ncbi:MAG: hypothetical protein GXO93_00870, partial [FCB group bacterium]|nr:hypothetical protein [FCB group bacterium]
MGFRLCIKVLSILLLATLCSWGETTPPTAMVTANIMSMPLAFTVNQGQWPDSVLYRANAGRATMWFTKSGAYYQFTRTISVGQDSRGPDMLNGRQTPSSVPDIRHQSDTRQEDRPPDLQKISGRQTPSSAPDMRHQPDSIETIMIKAHFVGSNPNPQMVGEQEMEYKCNYFLGNDPAKWRIDVPNYQAIVYKDVYDGIDLKYYGNGKQMEYDFLVSPGSDPSQIKISYEGAKSVSVNEAGELVVETAWGTVTEHRPVVYQLQDGVHKDIVGEYRLINDKTFGFRLSEDFDRTLPSFIDPTLVYSTYLGGSGDDWGE